MVRWALPQDDQRRVWVVVVLIDQGDALRPVSGGQSPGSALAWWFVQQSTDQPSTTLVVDPVMLLEPFKCVESCCWLEMWRDQLGRRSVSQLPQSPAAMAATGQSTAE